MNKLYQMTKDGVRELEDELASLQAKRADIADAIKTARELGDLAENAEYQAARQEQERNDSRIAEIERILANSQVIRKAKSSGKVQLGSHVSLKSKDGKTKEFQVVGTVEADPLEGKISNESPIGQALLDKAVGDEVDIATPAETLTYKVTAIS